MGGSVRVSSGIKKYEKKGKKGEEYRENKERQHDSPCSVTVIDLCVRFQPAAFAQIPATFTARFCRTFLKLLQHFRAHSR